MNIERVVAFPCPRCGGQVTHHVTIGNFHADTFRHQFDEWMTAARATALLGHDCDAGHG